MTWEYKICKLSSLKLIFKEAPKSRRNISRWIMKKLNYQLISGSLNHSLLKVMRVRSQKIINLWWSIKSTMIRNLARQLKLFSLQFHLPVEFKSAIISWTIWEYFRITSSNSKQKSKEKLSRKKQIMVIEVGLKKLKK